jgi:nucleoside-diphosphate-sugar epimerase
MELRGEKIVLTGATGQVGLPLALALAEENEVVAPARFSDPGARERLEAAGVRCITADLGAGELDQVPTDATYVLHFAMSRTQDWDRDLRDNAEAVGLLLGHTRPRAFLHCSTTSVYADTSGGPYSEDDPVGDSHGATRFLRTYSISKIAAEAVVRMSARLHGVPTTIARLNVPYGDNGGWPDVMLTAGQRGIPIEVPVGGGSPRYNPIHEDDIVAMVPGLLACASVPATTLNWGGEDVVSVQEWADHLADLTGVRITFVESPSAGPSVCVDLARQHELVGHARVHWKDGLRRMVAARHPGLLADA